MQLCISFGDDQAKINEPKSCFLMVQSYNKVEGHEGKKTSGHSVHQSRVLAVPLYQGCRYTANSKPKYLSGSIICLLVSSIHLKEVKKKKKSEVTNETRFTIRAKLI